MISTLLLASTLVASGGDVDVRFGAAGTIVPGGQVQLSHNTFYQPGQPAFTAMSGFIGPEVDYFVADDVSIGAGIGISGSASGGATLASLTMRLGVGYHLALSRDVGIYPRVSLVVGMSRGTWDPTNDQTYFRQSLSGDVYAPMLYHAGHFFIGMGPSISKVFFSKATVNGESIGNDGTSTSIAVATTIGGWF